MPQVREFYSDVDLKANQLFNSRLHNITTAARVALGLGLTTQSKGYMVYDTDLSTPYFWDGTQWLAASGSSTWGSITGTLTAQTDLITYLSTNYYPVTNPAGYITSSALTPYLTSATAAATYVPQTRTITINGTAYDLTADRSWTVSGLPSQATHAGQWLTTDGTNASWSVLSGNVSLFTNDAGYLDQTAADLLYYPLSSNPANYLTSETDPVFTAWLNTPPNISIFNNDSGYITGGDVPTFESDPVFSAWLSSPPNISIFTNDAGYLNYIPTLQQVTTAGATTDKSITISNASGISNPFIKVSDASADAKLYIDILNGKGKLLLQYNNPSISVFDGILQPASLTSIQTWTLPNATGNLTLSVNGQTANANGAITIPVGTGTVTSVGVTNGTGISASVANPTTTPNITITNTAPDQTVVLSNGTGISTSGTYPNFTITNSAPDQTVVLNNGTGISVTGTYPNFTITNTSTSGNSRSVNSVSTNTTAASAANTDYVYLVSGTTTITLPSPASNTNLYTIKRTGTGVVSIATTSGLIDGSTAPININVQYVSIDLISDGTNWFII